MMVSSSTPRHLLRPILRAVASVGPSIRSPAPSTVAASRSASTVCSAGLIGNLELNAPRSFHRDGSIMKCRLSRDVFFRFFATQKEESETKEDDGANEEGGTVEDPGEAGEVSREEQLEAEVKELKDQLLRGLAEQENTRAIAKRDVASAKAFAVTSFAKSLLDTSDNLTRALESVPEDYRNDTENHPVLATLFEGIKMTDENLLKAFAKNGLIKFGKAGDSFDPNLHDALFEYPDPEKEAGTVGQVMKAGFKLNDRVIRPAEVGVVKKA